MKYYGFVFAHKEYKIQESQAHDNPYAALLAANKEWQLTTDYTRRLLVVLRSNDAQTEDEFEDRAFFQFSSFQACINFASKQSEIIWSTEKERLWNGDINLMTT